MSSQPDFDVAIIGLGPVGATLAHLLGLQGVNTLVLERAKQPYPLPRAVHFDDEIMRVFQWIGVAEPMLPFLRVNPGMRFVDMQGKLLLDWPRPQQESTLGWHPSWRFHQPDLERVLRAQLINRTTVKVRTGCEVRRVADKGDHVLLWLGTDEKIRAKYVVGCDGAQSLVRRTMNSGMRDLGFHERWLVADVLLERDKPELGDQTVQYCDPDSPATYVRNVGARRRWEVKLSPEDVDTQFEKDSAVWDRLSRWISPDEARLERSAVYTFHSLIAEKWRAGRLFIAGDAAHQTPPFMGQGLCAGIRDVANLAWKLALAVSAPPRDRLLDSYKSEREPNVTCQSALKFDPLSASNIDPLGGEQARRCVALT